MEKIEKILPPIKEIKKMPNKKEKSLEALSLYQINQIEWLIEAIGASGLDEFMEYIRSPWKMLWPNFVAGIARGFWALVGVALVLAGIGWIFAITVDIPLIGKRLEPYVDRAQKEMNRYIEQTNYTDEFRVMEDTLKAIEANTTPRILPEITIPKN